MLAPSSPSSKHKSSFPRLLWLAPHHSLNSEHPKFRHPNPKGASLKRASMSKEPRLPKKKSLKVSQLSVPLLLHHPNRLRRSSHLQPLARIAQNIRKKFTKFQNRRRSRQGGLYSLQCLKPLISLECVWATDKRRKYGDYCCSDMSRSGFAQWSSDVREGS